LARVGNFLLNRLIQHKIKGLGLVSLTRLIKWVGLQLTLLELVAYISTSGRPSKREYSERCDNDSVWTGTRVF
jgi:hypothetical protein